MIFPYLQATPLPLSGKSQVHFSYILGFSSFKSPPQPGRPNNIWFRLCLIVTMIHEDMFNDEMFVSHGTSTPRAAVSRYHVTNR